MGADDVFKLLDRYSSPAMTKAAGLIVILYFAALGLLRLIDTWRSFRARRAILEEEKLFNEILKIRYEIEVLRKQYALPEFAAQLGAPARDAAQEQAQVGAQARDGAQAQASDSAQMQVGVQAPVEPQRQAAAAAPPVDVAHTRYGFALPAVPTVSFTPIAALFSLPFTRPAKGWQRARWALKWIVYLILLLVAFVAMMASFGAQSETAGALVGFGALGVAVLCVYFALTAFYNGVIAALAARGKRAAATAL